VGHREIPTSSGVSSSCHKRIKICQCKLSHVILRIACLIPSQAVSDRVQTPGRVSAEGYFTPGAGTSGASCQFGFDPRCLPGSDPAFDRVMSVAKPLYRCYLSCKDVFPTPSKKDEWAAIVWCEASVRAGTYPGPLFLAEWVSLVPV
jgi:hypothetical protein